MTTIIDFRWNRLATLAAALCIGAGLTHSHPAHAGRFGGLQGLSRLGRTAAIGARVYGRQSSGEYVLSRGELKVCLVLDAKLRPIADRLEASGTRIDQDQESLLAFGRDIERSDNLVDTTSQYEVDQFNRKVDRYNSRRAKLKGEVNRWNAELDAVISKFDRFDSQCGGRTYYGSDKTAVLASLNN